MESKNWSVVVRTGSGFVSQEEDLLTSMPWSVEN